MRELFRELFTSRRLAVVLVFGFMSGFPFQLTGSTLQAWMTDEQIDLATIGLFSLVTLPYSFKFLWSPFMDRYVPPFMGRRRGWIFLSQAALVISILGFAAFRPSQSPTTIAVIACAIAFFSASQDIVIDAFRAEVLPTQHLGFGAALNLLGYRVATLVSGGVVLGLAQYLPWSLVFVLTAACMGFGLLATWWAPEPIVDEKPPKTLRDAVVLPFVEFFKRKGSFEVLTFVLLYKLDAVVAVALLTPFLLSLGFEKTEVAAALKGVGFAATIIGSLSGGLTLVKIGVKKSLWLFGLLQGISGLSLMILATLGKNYVMLFVAIAAENFFTGMATSAFLAFLMQLCDKRFTATQYALLSSFTALTRTLGSAPSGYLAKSMGWPDYFLMSVLIAIPGLLMLLRYDRWTVLRTEPKAP